MMYNQHALSAVFPAMPENELAELAADISEHDLRAHITLYEGKILDGWHRYKACIQIRKQPRFVDYKGSDPVAFVRSANWHRRHLTPSQRALVEVELNKWKPVGRSAVQTENGQNCPITKSTAQMAASSGVSTSTIKSAKAVAANGADVLKDAVRDAKIPVDKAARIAKLPKEQQAKALKAPKKKTAPNKKPDSLEQKYATLKKDYNFLVDKHNVLVDELRSVEAFRSEKAVIELKHMGEYLRTAERRRDELMIQVREMRSQINYWKKRAEKSERGEG